MKYLQLKENLKKEILPVYAIVGEDDYLISNAIKIIKKATVDNLDDLNYQVFDNDNFEINNIINSLQQLNFISSKRMVVVHVPDKIKKEDINILNNYITNPNIDVVLVLVDKQKYFKNLEIIDCNKLSSQELLKVLPNFFAKYNKSISLEAANHLIDICQNDTMRLSKEVEKLSYFSDNEVVSKSDIEQIIKTDLQFEVFKLINYIASKNKNEAVKQINSLIESKEDIIGVLSLISATFRRMFYCKISNLSSEELAEKLSVKLFAITKAKQNNEHFSAKQLKKILELCEEVDFLTKQSQLSPANALHYLIFNIFIM